MILLSIDDTGVTKSHWACLIIIELARIGFCTRASGVSTGCSGGKSGNGIGGPRSVLGVIGVDEAVGVAGVVGSGEFGWSGAGGRWSSVAGGPGSGSSGICWGRTSS